MPRILEGRRRGFGGGTRGFLADGDHFYQRREHDERKPGPQQQQTAATTDPLIPNPDTSSSTAPAAEAKAAPPQQGETNDKQISIDEARRIFQRRKARKKKRTSLLSPAGILEDNGFSFGSKTSKTKPKQQQPQNSSLSPYVSNGPSDHPTVTPAASIASFVDHDVPTTEVTTTSPVDNLGTKHDSTRESPLSWQSPRPHSPTFHETHKQEIEALKKSHGLQLEEMARKHKQEIEEQQLKLNAEAQEWKEKCDGKESTIKELTEQHAQSQKSKDEEHSKALQEVVSQLEEKHRISNQEKEEQHSKAITEAVEAERARAQTTLEEKEKVLYLVKKELEYYKAKLRDLEMAQLREMAGQQAEMQATATRLLMLSKAQRECHSEFHRNQIVSEEEAKKSLEEGKKAASEDTEKTTEEPKHNPVIMEESSAFFSNDSSADTPPHMSRLPLVERFVFSPRQNFAVKKKAGCVSNSPSVQRMENIASAPMTGNNSAVTPVQHSENQFRSSDKDFELSLAQATMKNSPSATNKSSADNPFLSSERDFELALVRSAAKNSSEAEKKETSSAVIISKSEAMQGSSEDEKPRVKGKPSRKFVRKEILCAKSLHQVIPSFKTTKEIGTEERKTSKRPMKQSKGEISKNKRYRIGR